VIQLSRNKIFLLIIVILLLLQFVPLLLTYAFNKTCTGKIIQILYSESSYSDTHHRNIYLKDKTIITKYRPLAEYTVNNLTYTLGGPVYYEVQTAPLVGDKVTILYDPSEPEDAHFLNLSGFWFKQYLLKLFILLVITIGIYHFLHPQQMLFIRAKRANSEKYIELTKRPTDAKKSKLLNWIQMSKGKRR